MKQLDPFHPLYPNHFTSDDPLVRKTRVYEGHRIVVRDPYNFWSALDREDGKPLHSSLVDCQFTTIDVIQTAIDEALKKEAQGPKPAKVKP